MSKKLHTEAALQKENSNPATFPVMAMAALSMMAACNNPFGFNPQPKQMTQQDSLKIEALQHPTDFRVAVPGHDTMNMIGMVSEPNIAHPQQFDTLIQFQGRNFGMGISKGEYFNDSTVGFTLLRKSEYPERPKAHASHGHSHSR